LPTNGRFLFYELVGLKVVSKEKKQGRGRRNDWCGGQIESNTRNVLERLVGDGLEWTRIALTEEQVEHYRLEDKQIMKPDHRYSPVRYYPAVETGALKQQVIVQIIRAALDTELPEPLSHVLERERR